MNLGVSINSKSLSATILPILNDIGKSCFGRFQSPTDFSPKFPGYSYGFTAQRTHSDVICLQCHPTYTDDIEIYEYEIGRSQWSYRGNLITNIDLGNPYKTVLLAWGNYADGTYILTDSIIGKYIAISVGINGRIRVSAWVPPNIDDIRSIVIPGGIIDVKILSATQVQITGTTADYRVRDILAM